MPGMITERGGARVGWGSASWPFAKLMAGPRELILEVILFGTYTFTPQQVVSLERYGSIPFLGRGLIIHHSVPEYPEKIIFWCLGDPDKLIAQVRELGFVPVSAAHPASIQRPGIPVRWQALASAIVIWNVLLYLDWGYKGLGAAPEPGLLSLVAVLFLFLTCIGIRMFRPIQRLFLKEGREFGEIAPWVDLLTLISGPMMAGILIWYLISKGFI